MSRLRRNLAIFALIMTAFFLLLFLTILFIPDRDIKNLVSRVFENNGYSFSAKNFGKAFPLGIKADRITIGDERGDIFTAENAGITLEILPFFVGEVQFALNADVRGGKISGEYNLYGSRAAAFAIRGVQLEDIPFFKTVAGATVKGYMNAEGSIRSLNKNASGYLKLSVRGAEARGIKIGEMPLPDSEYQTIQGMVKVSSGKAVIESFSLQGEGLFIRLSGDFPLGPPPSATPLNLMLELMPKPDFMEKQKLVFLLLAKYIASPGAYRIPVRGTLAHPSI